MDAYGNPVYDDKGNPVIMSKTNITDIANNVASVLASFSTALSGSLDKVNKRDGKKAGKKMKEFDGMIRQLGKLAKNTDELDITAKSLMNIATSIGALADAINKIDLVKASAYAEITRENTGVGGMMHNIAKVNQERKEDRGERQVARIEARKGTTPTTSAIKAAAQPIINTEELAAAIGASVASAFRSGQFQFEFATQNAGVLTFPQ